MEGCSGCRGGLPRLPERACQGTQGKCVCSREIGEFWFRKNRHDAELSATNLRGVLLVSGAVNCRGRHTRRHPSSRHETRVLGNGNGRAPSRSAHGRLHGQDTGARLSTIPGERGMAQVMLAAQNGQNKTCGHLPRWHNTCCCQELQLPSTSFRWDRLE